MKPYNEKTKNKKQLTEDATDFAFKHCLKKLKYWSDELKNEVEKNPKNIKDLILKFKKDVDSISFG